jgi:hypothetical protein
MPDLLSSPRATIFIASSGIGLCSALASSYGARIQTSHSSSVVQENRGQSTIFPYQSAIFPKRMPDHAGAHRIQRDITTTRKQASLSIGAARVRPSQSVPLRR